MQKETVTRACRATVRSPVRSLSNPLKMQRTNIGIIIRYTNFRANNSCAAARTSSRVCHCDSSLEIVARERRSVRTKKLDHLTPDGPTCLQNAAEVPNVTPPCQLLSCITTHDLFPLIRLFFISAPGISRGTGYPSVIYETCRQIINSPRS